MSARPARVFTRWASLVFCLAAATARADGPDIPAVPAAPPAGSVPLWNGRDLSGWAVCLKTPGPPPELFQARDGVWSFAGKITGYVRTEKTFSNYHLHVEYRWADKIANSGIFVHVRGPDACWPDSVQINVKLNATGDLIPQGGFAFDGRQETVPKSGGFNEKPAGEWNGCDVFCREDSIEVFVNGERKNFVDKLSAHAGHIALQLEGAPIEFRNLWLCDLPAAPAKTRDAATPLAWSRRMADAQMARLGDRLAYKSGGRWDYAANVLALSLLQLADATGSPRYFDFVKSSIGSWVRDDGTLQGWELAGYQLDDINGGKTLLELFQRTGEGRFRTAAEALRDQLRRGPRTLQGGFWHKLKYQHQMWLDGLYMGAPFYAGWARRFGETDAFDDVARQFRLIAAHTGDPKTGLFYHGWDEAKTQPWANKETGASACFWSRGMGWLAMGLVDSLDEFPPDHPARAELVALLTRLATGVVKYQDAGTGLWWQVTDQGPRRGNYLEASASSMFVYALAKGVNRHELPPEFADAARKGYAGLLRELVKTGADGRLNLTQCCKVAGLGQPDKRDGSFEYYVSEPIVENDLKAVGPFILAGIELAKLGQSAASSGRDQDVEGLAKTGTPFPYEN